MFAKLTTKLLALATLLAPAAGDTFHAHADGLRDQNGFVLDGGGNFPANRSLAHALHRASLTAGPDTVLVHGDLSGQGGVTLGLYSNPLGNKLGGLVNCEIRGADPEARIHGLLIYQRFAVAGLAFRDLAFDGDGTNHGVLFAAKQDREHVDMVFERCLFADGPAPGAPAWGIRSAGPSVGLVVLECTFRDLREHGIYTGNASEVLIAGCLFERCRRTGVQGTNRMWTGRSSSGLFAIERCTFTDCGQDGASAISMAGHLGTVRVVANVVQSPYNTGACLFWWEGPKPNNPIGPTDQGAWQREDGSAFDYVFVGPRNTFEVPNTQRFVLSVNASAYTAIAPPVFAASIKPAIWINRPNAGPPCREGSVVLGFDSGSSNWPAGEKLRWGMNSLSDAEIDDLADARR